MTGRPGGSAFLRGPATALAGGLLLYLAFPPRTFWWAAPIGVALFFLSLRDEHGDPVGPGRGFAHGVLTGLGLYVPLLPWIGEFVGTLPWLALAAACSLFTGLTGLLAALLPNRGGAAASGLRAIGLATLWSLGEAILSVWPFGGFPWGRLAFSQPDGPLVWLAALGGAPLASFGVAVTAAGLAVVVDSWPRRSGPRPRPSRTSMVGAAIALVPIAVAIPAASVGTGDEGPHIRIAAIQGDVDAAGWEFGNDVSRVLRNHVAETERLAASVEAGETDRPDVVLWPENASDLDALHNPVARDLVSRAARAIRVPIVLGTVVRNPDGRITNTVLVWDPVLGPGERHDKKFIQPFGEYMPMPGLFRLFSDHVDAAGNFSAGDGTGVVHAAGVAVGVATCYEVVFDAAFRDAVAGGARILTTPTNNATFGWTEMTWQQLAMSRVRAVEHDRAVVTAATSGVSAIIAPDGRILQHTSLFTHGHLVASLPLHTTTTPADRVGRMPEVVLCAWALAAAGFAIGDRLRHRNRHAAARKD